MREVYWEKNDSPQIPALGKSYHACISLTASSGSAAQYESREGDNMKWLDGAGPQESQPTAQAFSYMKQPVIKGFYTTKGYDLIYTLQYALTWKISNVYKALKSK